MLQTYKIDYTPDIQADALVPCKSLYEMPIGEQIKRFCTPDHISRPK